MNNQTIAAGTDFITATLLLSANAMPAHSRWKGEVDITSLQGNETGELIEYLMLTRCTLDAVAGVHFRVLDQTLQPAADERANVLRRLFFEIENTTDSAISFTEARLILGGRAAAVGFARPRPTLAALTPTPSTPFVVKDRDGAPLDSAHQRFSLVPVVANMTYADSAGSVEWVNVQNLPDNLGGSARIYDDAFTGAINGVNASFTTSVPFRPSSTTVFLNGVRQKHSTAFNYIENGSTIVFTAPPHEGDCVVIDFDAA